jgi:hypothetical protein
MRQILGHHFLYHAAHRSFNLVYHADLVLARCSCTMQAADLSTSRTTPTGSDPGPASVLNHAVLRSFKIPHDA